MSHEVPGGPQEAVGVGVLTSDNKHYLCIAEYHSKFPVFKQVDSFSPDNLTKTCEIIF